MSARHPLLAQCLLAPLACSLMLHRRRTPDRERTMPSQLGVQSAEELRARFLQYHQAGDVDAMMSLFYLKGASADMVALYRCGVPEPDQVVRSAEVSEITADRRTKSPHTLTPEKLLLLKLRRPELGMGVVEQFFYIGRSEGRFFLTLPTGELGGQEVMLKLKLTRLAGESDSPVEWPHVFRREHTTGPDRLAIAPREDPMGVLRDLATFIGPEFFVLYVLVVSRGRAECGRYESPPLGLVDVRIFIEEFRDMLTNDARHEFWIGSTNDRGMLVYDDHGIIYAYGPLGDFERSLVARGFSAGSFQIPAPHTHHFHGEYDEVVDRLLARWEWRRTELQPGDGG